MAKDNNATILVHEGTSDIHCIFAQAQLLGRISAWNDQEIIFRRVDFTNGRVSDDRLAA